MRWLFNNSFASSLCHELVILSESLTTVGNSNVVHLGCVRADARDKLLPLGRLRCEGLLLVDHAGLLGVGKLVNIGALPHVVLPLAVLVRGAVRLLCLNGPPRLLALGWIELGSDDSRLDVVGLVTEKYRKSARVLG